MALNDIIAAGVRIAHNITKSVQPNVSWRAWTGSDGYGAETYAAVVLLPAIVERQQRRIVTKSGQERVSQHHLVFLQAIPENNAAGRQQPIDERDELTLADGTIGPILEVGSIVNPSTGRGFLTEVWLGSSTGTGTQ